MSQAHEQDVDVSGSRKGIWGGSEPEEPVPSRMKEIIHAIEDPESTDLEATNRLIAMEIALVLSGVREYNTKAAMDKVKVLRELTKTLQEGDTLAKKDFLNFDGPKFKYVLGELVVLFKASLKSSGFKEEDINHTLRIFRDSLGLREADLRKETERITSESLFTNVASPEAPAQGN